MVANYALSRAFHFLLHKKSFYGPYFIAFLLINFTLIPVERSLTELGLAGTFLTLLLAVGSIIIQVSLICNMHQYSISGEKMGFLESLWPGLCYTPGFILQTIKLFIYMMVGLLLLILPGLYLGLKHCLDPYYSIIGGSGALFNHEHPFTRNDLVSVLITTTAFAPLAIVFNIIPMTIDVYLRLGLTQYISAPFSTLTSLYVAIAMYFYTEYTIRIKRKK